MKLEDWQVNVIDFIKCNKSVLVCAPTSSGKTILSTYFAQIGKKIIYIVPSKPLAFQVAAIFNKIINNELSLYVEDFSIQSSDPQIIIGTPYELESRLPNILSLNFDLAVYDEIHNLNYIEGDSYERIIKSLDINFLALSATIVNPKDLSNWWNKIHPDKKLETVIYKRRFINTQRYMWSDKLIRLHPFNCFDNNLWENINNCENINLPFTPLDSFSVWESINDLSPELGKEYDPENIFSDKYRIDLNDAKLFEEKIKQAIKKLKKNEREIIKAKYQVEDNTLSNQVDIYNLVITLKKGYCPAILFNQDALTCLDIFKTLINKLEDEEIINYPFYYNDLEYKNKLFTQYRERRNTLEENLKEEEKYDKLLKFDQRELLVYHSKIIENYKKNLTKLTKMMDNVDNDQININNWSINTIKKQINLLTETKEKDLSSNSLEDTDIFEKHPDFSFTRVPMKAHTIRKLRKEISKKLDTKIRYTNCLIQGLKRGIGIYTKNLPDIYLRIVQELAQNKELGIVFSDDSLALGINMPFKTVVILGWKDKKETDNLVYNQMIGRAGRRGLDVEGNIIYANVDWKRMINLHMNKIQGINKIDPIYGILSLNSDLDISKIKTNFLYDIVNGVSSNYQLNRYQDDNYDIQEINLIWKLRKYGDRAIFINDYIQKLEIFLKDKEDLKIVDYVIYDFLNILFLKKDIDITDLHKRDLSFVQKEIDNNELIDSDFIKKIYLTITQCYIDQNIGEREKYNLVNNIYELGSIYKICFNSILDLNIPCTKKIIYNCFIKCKNQVYNYLQLNSN